MSINSLPALPTGWEWHQLSDVCSLITDGSHFSPTPQSAGKPIGNVKDMRDGSINLESCTKISEKDFQFLKRNNCSPNFGDVLLSKDGTIGKVIVFKQNIEIVVLSSIAILRPSPAIHSEFLGQALRSFLFTKQVEVFTSGSALRRLVLRDIAALSIPLPPLDEQRCIAEILDTVDEAIAHTEALVTKLKQIKAGLLYDLLTCGLDENGQLRDAIAQPEQFKDSPLGRIPKNWELTTLRDVVTRSGGLIQTGPFGSQLHAYEYVDVGVPVIMPQDIQDDYISDSHIVRIPLEKSRTLARHLVELNDVVFARRGDLSRCVAINEREVGWLCGTGCLLFRPPEKEIDAHWLAATYRHERSQRQILSRAVGSTMVNLNSTLLAELLIAKPTYTEQIAIVKAINTHDNRISAEEAYYDKLKLQKKGLMHDLLIGRVRVNTLQELSA